MAVTGITKVVKWILIGINILVLCAGAIAIGLGAWGLGSEYGAEKLKSLTGSELYRGAAIAIIVGGCVLVTISFIGALGAFLENRWLLGTYFVIMLLLLILFVTAAAVGFAYRDELKQELTEQMEYTLVNQYFYNLDDPNDENIDATEVWDAIQEKLDCCGVTGGRDSEKSWFLWQKSKWFSQQSRLTSDMKEYVPRSCCVSKTTNLNSCQKLNNKTQSPPQTYYHNISDDNEYLNSKGCYTALEDFIFNHIVAIGGIAIAILIVMFICILLSVCVCTNIRKAKKGDAV